MEKGGLLLSHLPLLSNYILFPLARVSFGGGHQMFKYNCDSNIILFKANKSFFLRGGAISFLNENNELYRLDIEKWTCKAIELEHRTSRFRMDSGGTSSSNRKIRIGGE